MNLVVAACWQAVYYAAELMDLDDDFWEADPEPPSRRPDPAVESAGARIREIYVQKPKGVFFVRQLELMLERDFFHWVTDFAIRDLYESRFLRDEYMALSVDRTRLRFLFRPSHRARRRQMKRAASLVRRYSEPTFAKACGRYAQELFLAALLRRGFRLEAENARSFRGLEWKESDHDLDFIISDAGVVYGREVKNRGRRVRLDFRLPDLPARARRLGKGRNGSFGAAGSV